MRLLRSCEGHLLVSLRLLSERYTSVCVALGRGGGRGRDQVSPEAVSQVNQPWEANSIHTGKVVLPPAKLAWAPIA